MYISTENYEQMYLKDKDEKTIALEVEKLRREIDRVKTKLESPAYVRDSLAYPPESAVIDVYREYFELAADRLASLKGVTSVLTEEEKTSKIVNSMVEDISCLTLTVGRYLQDKYELKIEHNEAEIFKTRLGEGTTRKAVDKASALKVITSLYMGEWKEIYTPEQYGCTLNEPTRWEVRIDYVGKKSPRFYDGIGVFPYNFNILTDFLGADIID